MILSGTATDGTLGLVAIKADGRITFAQDESARGRLSKPSTTLLIGFSAPLRETALLWVRMELALWSGRLHKSIMWFRAFTQAAAFVAALLLGTAAGCLAALSQSSATVVEIETPLAAPRPLQGYLRHPSGAGPSPAVVLLHGCSGGWGRLDQHWGNRIAAWGYVTLTVDSFGPRGLKNTCGSGAPVDLAFDAYRALSFLVRQPFVDPARVVVLGFSQGGWLALTSIERGAIERSSQNKFRAAIAFYPPCGGFKGNMTVPTLILIGELDDWTLAESCRNMVEGRDDWGISRQKAEGAPVRLIVYPGAYHAFDVTSLENPITYFWHRLEFNKPATDQAIDAVREFLHAAVGGKEQAP